jgi:putative peptidoglycan lipid II flippase
MVRRVINLVYGEIRGLHQAAYILALFAIGSQMLALVRDRLLAHTFGAGGELDLYYAAFRIPDLLFALFASVLSVYVLLPFVTKARVSTNAKAGAEILGQMFSAFLLVYALVSLLLFAFAPLLVSIIFPGFTDNSETLVLLMRILLMQPLLLGVSSLLGVITQLSQRFVLYALSPLVYNLGIIIGILFLYPIFGLSGLVFGVVVGAFGHLLIQLPLVKTSDLSFGFVGKIKWLLIKEILTFALPRAFTLSIHQIVLLVLVSFASLMTVGSVSTFQFAYNLQSVPLAIIGMSYSVAAFPVLADLFAKQKKDEFSLHVLSAFRHIIFWSVPIIGLVIILRAQIVRVVLGSGAFNWNDTRLTAAMLAVFVFSLLAQSLLLLLTRAFYAGGNSRLPFKVALIGATTSILSAFGLLHLYENFPGISHWVNNLFRLNEVLGTEVLILAFSFALGIIFEVMLLVYYAQKEFYVKFSGLLRNLLEAILAGFAAAISAYATLIFIVDGINQETFIGILLQGGLAGLVGITGAMVAYYGVGSKELHEIYTSFRLKILKTDVIAPQTE